jgi:membrane fusion protein, copper/silver efflux system
MVGIATGAARAQREHTRPGPRGSTTVTESQASELTLTLTEAAVRPIQIWVRTAGVIDASRTTVTANVGGDSGARIKVGQRVRAFTPESRSRMYQANVSAVTRDSARTTVKATLMGRALDESRHFILEIVTEDSESLSVPNEAIIEAGGKRLVYVQEAGGGYAPREVQVGVQGELFTEVLDGLNAGDQVVTIGSFFIDAEHKLKGS